ncbi:LysE/ArgO family amino acid transporter [Campylobacter sp. VTCC 70190]|uniref:LysE/ArgO family amino acid transporter n=1 Tax=Campylobacter sp. VTCC 70190 TaxID=3392118 RepID=UPI00398ED4F6
MTALVFFKGFFLALSLIMAIGAQNAFVIKQAFLKRYVFIICTLCFVSDVFLMSLGIFGVGEFLGKNRLFSFILALGGIAFCLFYALLSFRAAFSKEVKSLDEGIHSNSLKKTLLLTLAFTYLNPHAYLDTIFLIGAAALNFSFDEKISFALGSYCASLVWFFSLGYGVKILSSTMKNPNFLRLIDFFTACVMCVVAYSLIAYVKNI